MGKVQLTIWVPEQYLPALLGEQTAGQPDRAAVQMEMPRLQTSRETTQLTPRERAVLEQLCRYDRIQQVADALFVQPDTVRKHLRHIYEKLGVHSIHRAVARAVALGLIVLPKERIG
jgi:DNA-binding CsgD family transcriptional regulator